MNDNGIAHEAAHGDPSGTVHRILEVGLVISVVLFVIGLVLSVVKGIPLPNTVTPPGDIVQQMIALQPAGFLSMGLLALIVTPFVRVMGSLLVFLLERDWLYAGVTATVFVVMLASALFGQG